MAKRAARRSAKRKIRATAPEAPCFRKVEGGIFLHPQHDPGTSWAPLVHDLDIAPPCQWLAISYLISYPTCTCTINVTRPTARAQPAPQRVLRPAPFLSLKDPRPHRCSSFRISRLAGRRDARMRASPRRLRLPNWPGVSPCGARNKNRFRPEPIDVHLEELPALPHPRTRLLSPSCRPVFPPICIPLLQRRPHRFLLRPALAPSA